MKSIEAIQTITQENERDAQADSLRILRKNVNIIFHDYILRINGELGYRISNGVIIAPNGNQIRVGTADLDTLNKWHARLINELRNTVKRPPFDNGQTENMIKIFDKKI